MREHKDQVETDECVSHWCYDPSEGQCEVLKRNPVLAGTWCDIGKWCIEGQCIQEETITSGSHKPKCNSTYTAVKSNKDSYCVTDEGSCL